MATRIPLDDLILKAQKPSRYSGGELNAVVKTLGDCAVRWGLCFPDTYEVGMSNLGFRVLYDTLNQRADTACERFFQPWMDLEALLRSNGEPLFSIESRAPARAFDVLGFSLQFELCYTTVLAMLDLGQIPLLASERRRDDPLILGGGPCTYNPEPVAPFFDAFVVGEGEEVVHEISDLVVDWKQSRQSREDLLWRLADVPGVYVPSLFRASYNDNKTLRSYEPLKPGYEKVTRRVIPDLNVVPQTFTPIMPFMQTVHDRLPLEIQRGCTRGCRFCQVGMITRPTRQRDPKQVLEYATKGLESTGYDEVGFLSLSAGDYGCLNGMLEDFFARFAPENIAVSLPSLRTETMNDRLAEQIRKVKKSGFTVAPEAATERLRRVINKGNSEADLVRAVESIFRAGWSLVKFYFMIGLPTERDEDVAAIVEVAHRCLQLARKHAPNAEINVGVSTFVPKPFTPFQWEAMIPIEETNRKHQVLRDAYKKLGSPRQLRVKPHDARQSSIEGALALGDRRVATAILEAYRRGQRLDGWTEHFRLDVWNEAFGAMEREHGVGVDWLSHRERTRDEVLPWDHIDAEVSRPYLWKEREASRKEAELVDCVLAPCTACGACDYEVVDTRVYTPDAYTPAAKLAPRPPEPSERTFVRVRYAKEDRAVFLSHLETMTALLRALRRARLTVAFKHGHTPRPKVGFGPALPVGASSGAELMDVELVGEITADDVARALAPHMPPGFRLLSAVRIPNGSRSLSSSLREIGWRVTLPGLGEAPLRARVAEFHAKASVVVQRERTQGDVKPLELKAFVRTLDVDGGALRFTVRADQDGSVRPSEVLSAVLGEAPPPGTRLRRESVAFEAS